MAKYVFVIAFVVATLFQGLILLKLDIADISMWANQAQFVKDSNPNQFNLLGAYGHPGGPIIEGVVLIHEVFNISYEKSLLVFLTIFSSLIIGWVCLLCYIINRDHFWWPIVLSVTSLNPLYQYSTPTSTIASLLVLLLCLFTLFLYKKRELIKLSDLMLWSLIAGLLVATRFDIGFIMVFAFMILLKQKINWKQMLFISSGVIPFFIVFNPFMWFMPIKHLEDIFYKIIYHYNDFTSTKMSWFYVLSFSSLTVSSIFVSLINIFLDKRDNTILPIIFSKVLIVVTFGLYIIFMTAKYQASRYFLPVVLIWETFLPILFLPLLDNHNHKNFIKSFIVAILVLYPIGMFAYVLFIDITYNFLP